MSELDKIYKIIEGLKYVPYKNEREGDFNQALDMVLVELEKIDIDAYQLYSHSEMLSAIMIAFEHGQSLRKGEKISSLEYAEAYLSGLQNDLNEN